jgi:pyrrolidone-carboxylate peptidase
VENEVAFAFESLAVSGVPLRRKLAVGSAGDPAEGEADRIAERVMRMPASGPLLQRACATCEKDDEKVHRKENGAGPSEAPDIVHDVLSSGGRPLDASTRAFMEPRFGHDFARVRVHTDARAAQSAGAVNARAYTVGSDIVFGGGAYAPHSESGRSLLAHELAHTLQQSGGAPLRRRWDKAPDNCQAQPEGRWIKTITVDQKTDQNVTLAWSDGKSDEPFPCSTGKGHCCAEDGSEAAACHAGNSSVDGSNCTQMSTGSGFPVQNRDLDHGGIAFWTEFVPARGIALHKYAPVDGSPLSHGCVRLSESNALRIFCGAKQFQTMVKVVNPAKPKCSNTNLQAEWMGDFSTASTELDGETPPKTRANVLETRNELTSAFGGKTHKPEEYGKLTAADIPRCVQRTTEENRLTTPSTAGGKTGADMMTGTPEEKIANDFATAYAASTSKADALALVKQKARELWQTARTDVQRNAGAKNDRPLYWARLKMSQTIRTAKPRWMAPMNGSDIDSFRQSEIDALENSSRGMDDISFAGAQPGDKKILITGFDPFSLGGEIRRSNPSGAAVLDLDGKRISSGSGATAKNGAIEGAILPVRFEDFDKGMVESLIGPQVGGTNHVDMVVTVSQGSSSFELERYAGRARSEGEDNQGQTFGSHQSPDAGKKLKSKDEFIETTTTQTQRDAMAGKGGQVVTKNGHTFSVYTDDMVKARKNGAETDMTGLQAINEKDPAIVGSGGGFLSNEVFYRAVSTVKTSANPNIPMIHLHTPALTYSGSDADFESMRTGIVQAVQEILTRVLPTLP